MVVDWQEVARQRRKKARAAKRTADCEAEAVVEKMTQPIVAPKETGEVVGVVKNVWVWLKGVGSDLVALAASTPARAADAGPTDRATDAEAEALGGQVSLGTHTHSLRLSPLMPWVCTCVPPWCSALALYVLSPCLPACYLQRAPLSPLCACPSHCTAAHLLC